MATYRLRVQRITEFFVDVDAANITEARQAVESKRGVLDASEGLLPYSAEKPATHRVVGKHMYVENGIARRK